MFHTMLCGVAAAYPAKWEHGDIITPAVRRTGAA